MVRILLYGLQRSGTNFVKSLLDRNFQTIWENDSSPRNSPAHKHYRPYGGEAFPTQEYRTEDSPKTFRDLEARLEPPLPTYYLIVSKSPYSWLLSYKKWARRCDWPEPDHHYIEEWNHFYRTWLKWGETTERIIFVRYIDVLENVEQELQRIRKDVGLKKRWQACFLKMIPSKVEQSPNFDKERRLHYLEKKFLEEYSQKEIGVVNKNLANRVVKRMGYEVKFDQ